MARKKCKCPEGVPGWVVTYGDMMTLLLCFFILLAAFSELKKDREFQEVIRAVQEAFGHTGGAGHIPTQESPEKSIVKITDAITLYRDTNRQISRSDDPGVEGKESAVTQVREGMKFTVGGRIAFDPGSAVLKPTAKAELARLAAQELRGKTNKLEVRGHAANRDLPETSPYDNLLDLSFARAVAVMKFLTDPAQGIDPDRIRVTACGNSEPLRSRAYAEPQIGVNRRVELILVESLVTDYQDEIEAAPDAAP